MHYVVVERDEKYMASFDEMVRSSSKKWTRHWLKLVLYLGRMAMKHPHDNIRVGAITFVYSLQSEAGYFPAFLLPEIP